MIRKSFPGVLALVLYIILLPNSSLKAQQALLTAVNSEYNEQNPVLSPDGRTLFFTRSHHPGNVGGRRDKGDIWFSKLGADLRWSAPVNARELNNADWNGVLGFNDDGSAVYLHNHYREVNGLVRSQGIARAIRSGKKWKTPIDIDIPYFRNLSATPGGSISGDGKVLLLSIESYGSRGAEDIYVCLKQNNGQWTAPKNLGSTINTPYQEFSPVLSDDHKTLYFASNGLNGKGSSDIFMTRRLDDSWTNWSTPALVAHVNTRGREKDYRTYSQFALYSSTINSDGYSDIKIYTELPEDSVSRQLLVVEDSTLQQDTEEIVPEITEAFTIYGRVLNERDKSAVDAIITYEKGPFRKEIASNAGAYSINLPDSGAYEVIVAAPGFISERRIIHIGETLNEAQNYSLTPLVAGTTVSLENVLFQRSTANILESSYKELDMVVDLMKQNPSMKIRVEGHTDNRGVPRHNLRLSKKRAQAVEEYLVEHGISSRRVSRKGYGGSRPVADNEDPELRKLNRRVEFTIIKE